MQVPGRIRGGIPPLDYYYALLCFFRCDFTVVPIKRQKFIEKPEVRLQASSGNPDFSGFCSASLFNVNFGAGFGHNQRKSRILRLIGGHACAIK